MKMKLNIQRRKMGTDCIESSQGPEKWNWIAKEARPSCAWHVEPLHWTRVTRMTTDQGDLGDEVDQSGQGDEDYQGVQGCIWLYCTVLGCGGL